MWAPRGERIAYYAVIGGYGVACFVNADGSRPRCTHDHSLTSVVWSHDGKRIAFRQATPRRLGIVDSDARHVRYLGFRGRWARPAAWSPDGRRLLYGFNSRESGKLVALSLSRPRHARVVVNEGEVWVGDVRWQRNAITYVAVRHEEP